MKFWDTIAKMCGVEVDVRPKHSSYLYDRDNCPVGESRHPWSASVVTPVGRMTIVADSDASTCEVSVNGQGVRLRDASNSNINAAPAGAFMRLGLIDIERIRPMVTKIGRVNTDFVGSVLRDAHKDAADLPS